MINLVVRLNNKKLEEENCLLSIFISLNNVDSGMGTSGGKLLRIVPGPLVRKCRIIFDKAVRSRLLLQEGWVLCESWGQTHLNSGLYVCYGFAPRFFFYIQLRSSEFFRNLCLFVISSVIFIFPIQIRTYLHQLYWNLQPVQAFAYLTCDKGDRQWTWTTCWVEVAVE